MLKVINFAKLDSNEFKTFSSIYNNRLNNPWMHWARRLDVAFHPIFLDQSEAGKVFLYFHESEPIGICRIILSPEGAYQHLAKIASVAIDPKYQGKGHGKKILDELKQYIIDHHPEIARLELTFEMDNAVAMLGRIYDKAGFVRESYYNDWFRSSDDLYQAKQHPWYSGEIFSGMLLESQVKQDCYFPSKPLAQIKQNKLQTQNDNYNFSLAKVDDTNELTTFFEKGATELSHLPLSKRKEVIQDKISRAKIYTVRLSKGQIVAAGEVDAKLAGLGHIAMLNNIQIDLNQEDAGIVLFKNLIAHSQDSNPDVKRLELKLPASQIEAIEALQAIGFDFTGSQKYRFKDQDGHYHDEHFFEYSLFNLDDALECCQRRKNSESKLQENKETFHFPLSFNFLNALHHQLQSIKISKVLDAEQERILFKLVRILCTQDCFSPTERHHQCAKLKETFPEMFSIPAIVNLYQLCVKQLKPSSSTEFFEKNSHFQIKKEETGEPHSSSISQFGLK
ncbi:MAG: GNAT family N-acetyltransferase [Gammaproteobacteria bacterium]|nr:GNAT family N-acetyltransferase [Gammaproteobacteria bacterium]